MTTLPSSQTLEHAASKVYSYMLLEHSGNWGMDMAHWDWVPGVGAASILEYYQQDGGDEIISRLSEWALAHLHQSGHAKVINSMAPFAIFPALYSVTGNPVFKESAVRTGQYMLHEAPRTREGAFEHTVTEQASFPEQVWADTVFMVVLFLARLARLTGETGYAREALSQLELHLRLLEDKQSGVLFHGWNCITGDHMSAARWTRANAWIALAAPMILQEVDGLLPVPASIPERYRRLMAALIGYQSPSGLWHTVMDRTDFYLETSGSAGIAAGIFKAVRMGLLGEAALGPARAALEAVLGTIKADGEVSGVSGGTPVMPTVEDYNEISCIPTLYGQGLVLILLAEAMK